MGLLWSTDYHALYAEENLQGTEAIGTNTMAHGRAAVIAS